MFGFNSWLITNTQLYFADQLLDKDWRRYNAYGLLDLSNLLNAIVLSDKIFTLPGFHTEIKNKLQHEGGSVHLTISL